MYVIVSCLIYQSFLRQNFALYNHYYYRSLGNFVIKKFIYVAAIRNLNSLYSKIFLTKIIDSDYNIQPQVKHMFQNVFVNVRTYSKSCYNLIQEGVYLQW